MVNKITVFAAGAVTAALLSVVYGQFSAPASDSSIAEPIAPPVNSAPPASIASAADVAGPVAEPAMVLEITPSAEILEELQDRMVQAELRIDELEAMLASREIINPPSDEFQPPAPQAFSKSDLTDAGIEAFVVDEIFSVRDQLQLQRLELRDLATREGWLDSDRFRDSMDELRADSRLREVIGEDDFDRLLLAEGRDNRVRIDSVISGSAADIAGVMVGDVIYKYADERIFSFVDLRRQSTAGQRDEPVRLQLTRNGDSIELVIPRGPLGVTLSGVQDSSFQ